MTDRFHDQPLPRVVATGGGAGGAGAAVVDELLTVRTTGFGASTIGGGAEDAVGVVPADPSRPITTWVGELAFSAESAGGVAELLSAPATG